MIGDECSDGYEKINSDYNNDHNNNYMVMTKVIFMMNRILPGLALFVASTLLYAQTSTAQDTQVCQSNIHENTLTSRFTDQKDGTVLDTQTQLVWKRCSEGQRWDADDSTCSGRATGYTWPQALNNVQILNSGGGYANYSDWRLPNNKELESIVSLHCSAPAINLEVFPNTARSTFYWSSTPYLYASNNGRSVWVYKFDRGTTSVVPKGAIEQVRLVRGGLN